MADIEFEAMRRAHIPAVLRIEREAFKSPWTAEMFLQELEDNGLSRSCVALEGGNVIGYFIAWFLHQEVHLLNIAVAASRQRKGVGRRMLQLLLEMAKRELKVLITLEVRESNAAAIEMYRSFGFTPVGLRRHYYQDDKENALLMLRPVSDWDGGGWGEDGRNP
jgi:ribosomal-protein-alanine N-acetyltransferase